MGDVGQMFGFGESRLAENQEIEHVSYREKLSASCCGMGLGFLLFFGGLGLAGWNEYRNVASMKSINEASDVYKEASCSPINSELENELVHVTCTLGNFQVMGQNDPVLQGIAEQNRTGLALDSYMEVYQWGELTETHSTQDSVGGGTTTVTTYTYNRGWSATVPDAVNAFFKQGESCKTQNNGYSCLNWNPVDEPWWSLSGYKLGNNNIETAKDVKAGHYVVPNSELIHLGTSQVLNPACANSSSSTTSLVCSPGGASLKGSKMVWQKQDSNNQMIDYLTRSYSLRTADTISVLAKQKGDTFVYWESTYDEDYGMFEFVEGSLTAAEMRNQEEAERVGVTWVLRFLSLLFCIVGLVMVTAPLTEIPDIIPIVGPWVGDLIGYALWVVDCFLGCCCWSVVVSIAWIAYRPTVAISLLCTSAGLCVLGSFLAYANHKKKQSDDDAGSPKIGEAEVEVAEEYTPEEGKERSPAPEATVAENDDVAEGCAAVVVSPKD